MIALQYSTFGEPTEVVTPVDLPRPEPGSGQTRLRMVRSPIHNHDLATIRGVYGVKPKLPAIPGSEMLGIVDAIGEDDSGIQKGMRVATITQGAWAHYALAATAQLLPVPESIEDDLACQLLAMPLSALVLLEELRVSVGDSIVLNAANGAVGRILIREATKRGINAIGLVRSEETARQLREFGAPHVVVTEGDWAKHINEITKGAPVVRAIDSIAGTHSMELQRILGQRGELIVFGGLAGQAMRLDPGLMISRELVVRGFWMTAWSRRPENASRMAHVTQRVFELAELGELPLSVCAVYSLNDASAALKAAETPGRGGKVLFKP